jgi:hypothetical protein
MLRDAWASLYRWHAEELFGGRIEINQGWRGTIVADADTPTPLIEFTQYREIPILVHLDVGNLSKARAHRRSFAPRQSESTHRSRNAVLIDMGLAGLPRNQMGEDSCANIEMKSNGH